MQVWQYYKLWNDVRDDAKSTKQCKDGMQESPKLETSQRTQTMAMQGEPQRAKGYQNSPKAGQDRAKNKLETSQHKLEHNAKSMRHARLQKGCYTTPIKTKHGMT